jgi:hypothetical protein
VWEFVIDKYFALLRTNIDDLRARIAVAVGEVTPEKLRRTREQSDYRWDICRAASGSYISHYL